MKQKIKIIGLEDFIAMKIFAGSPKDLSDASGVLKGNAQKIDKAFLKDLTRRYGRKELRRLEQLFVG